MDSEQQKAAPPQPRPPTQNPSILIILIVIVFLSFIAIAAMVLMITISSPSSIKNSFSTLHQVPEGHVGVYWRGGALLQIITGPGFHLKMPFVTQYETVQVTLHTDMVTDIPCGTKEGVMINFERIEVVNRLHKEYVYHTLLNYGVYYDKTWIYDNIPDHINHFCTSHSLQQVYIDDFDKISEKIKEALQADCTRYAPGIEIINVRVAKPTIPDSIRRNFEQMEEERIKGLIAVERQKAAEKEAIISKKIAISEAEKNANVSKILMEQKLLEKDGSRQNQEIENQMFLQREKCRADANFYRETKEAEANRLKLTPEYLELKYIEAIGEIANAKRSFPDKEFVSSPYLSLSLLFLYLQLLARYLFRRAQNMIFLIKGLFGNS